MCSALSAINQMSFTVLNIIITLVRIRCEQRVDRKLYENRAEETKQKKNEEEEKLKKSACNYNMLR